MSSKNNRSGSSLGRILDNSSRRGNDDSEDDDLSLFEDVIESATGSGPRPNESRPAAPSRNANMSGSRLGERFRRTSATPASTSILPQKKTGIGARMGIGAKMGSIRNLWNPRGSVQEVDQSVNIMDLPYDPDAAARNKNGHPGSALQRSMVDIFLSDEASDPHLGSSLNWDSYGDKKKKSKKKCKTSSLIVLSILIIVILCLTFPAKGLFSFRDSKSSSKKPAPERASATRPPAKETEAPKETDAPKETESAEPVHQSDLENSLGDVPKTSRFDAIEYWILAQDVTDPDELFKSGSPAKRAHTWVARDDKAQLQIPGYDDMEFTMEREKEHQLLQRYALAVLYYSIEAGASATRVKNNGGRNLQITMAEELSNREKFDGEWMTSKNVCEWHGITCDSAQIYVTQISLAGHMLEGTLPRELFVGTAMPYLKAVDFSKNSFTGSFPYSLALNAKKHWPPSVQILKLGFNQLSGKIDDMVDLVNLREIDLDNNGMTGGIPATIDRLSNLEILILSSNQLTSIGNGLENVSTLKILRLDSNDIRGTIPDAFGNMAGMEELMISHNYFMGSIPKELGNLVKMEDLFLDGNALTGHIPTSLGHMTALQQFQADGNELSGMMPPEVCQLTTQHLVFLQSDCAGDGKIQCDCCTDCW